MLKARNYLISKTILLENVRKCIDKVKECVDKVKKIIKLNSRQGCKLSTNEIISLFCYYTSYYLNKNSFVASISMIDIAKSEHLN